MEEKDDKGKGEKEEPEVEGTTSQKNKFQERDEDRYAGKYDFKESKGI